MFVVGSLVRRVRRVVVDGSAARRFSAARSRNECGAVRVRRISRSRWGHRRGARSAHRTRGGRGCSTPSSRAVPARAPQPDRGDRRTLTIAVALLVASILVTGESLEMVDTNSGLTRWDDDAAHFGARHATSGTTSRCHRFVLPVGAFGHSRRCDHGRSCGEWCPARRALAHRRRNSAQLQVSSRAIDERSKWALPRRLDSGGRKKGRHLSVRVDHHQVTRREPAAEPARWVRALEISGA